MHSDPAEVRQTIRKYMMVGAALFVGTVITVLANQVHLVVPLAITVLVVQNGQGMMAVDIVGAAPFQTSSPKMLFKLPTPVLAPAQLSNVASPDGQRFIFAVNVTPRRAAQ